MIVVARGGGSLADLFAFCDETLCRTVALLRVPVISSRRPPHGPHAARRRRRRRLLDADARRRDRGARRLRRGPRGAGLEPPRGWSAWAGARSLERARTLARLSRAPAHHVERHRARLHQHLRELRAATAPRDRRRRAHERCRRPSRSRARRPPPPPRGDARRAARRRRTPRRWTAPPRRRWSAAAATWTASSARSPPTTPSARWSAATRCSRTRPASRSRARTRPRAGELTVRLHDGRVVVHPDARRRPHPSRAARRAAAHCPRPASPPADRLPRSPSPRRRHAAATRPPPATAAGRVSRRSGRRAAALRRLTLLEWRGAALHFTHAEPQRGTPRSDRLSRRGRGPSGSCRAGTDSSARSGPAPGSGSCAATARA